MSTQDSNERDKPFSLQVREGTTTEHGDAEHSKTMTQLVNGELPLEKFAAMQAQHAVVYEALEAALDAVADDPIVAPFADERLCRSASMKADLVALGVDQSTVVPTAATTAYAERIRQMAKEWPTGVVAHHYTRYLGDLSGGQHIRRVVERVYGIGPESGSSFFHFPDIDDLAAFKDEYRAKLDAMNLSPAEGERFINEVVDSYAMSTGLFFSLD